MMGTDELYLSTTRETQISSQIHDDMKCVLKVIQFHMNMNKLSTSKDPKHRWERISPTLQHSAKHKHD